MPFIVGVPRSGTTLLRFMLDAHPALAIPPESGFVSVIADLEESDDTLRSRFVEIVLGWETWPDLSLTPEAFRATAQSIRPFTAGAGLRALCHLHASRFGKPRWGDKTPLYCTALDRVRRVLPEARFIHIIRDGRDVALSLGPLWFAAGNDPETLARFWRAQIEAARALGVGRPDYLEVRYEALVREPRREFERVCARRRRVTTVIFVRVPPRPGTCWQPTPVRPARRRRPGAGRAAERTAAPPACPSRSRRTPAADRSAP